MKLTPDRFWMRTHSYTLQSHKSPWTHEDSLTGATLLHSITLTYASVLVPAHERCHAPAEGGEGEEAATSWVDTADDEVSVLKHEVIRSVLGGHQVSMVAELNLRSMFMNCVTITIRHSNSRKCCNM